MSTAFRVHYVVSFLPPCEEQGAGIGRCEAVRTKRVEEEDPAKADSDGDITGKKGPAYHGESDPDHVHGAGDKCFMEADDRDNDTCEDITGNRFKGDPCRFRVLRRRSFPARIKTPGSHSRHTKMGMTGCRIAGEGKFEAVTEEELPGLLTALPMWSCARF